MFERPSGGERALLVHVQFDQGSGRDDLDEFDELVRSAAADPVVTITARRSAPHPRLFVGSGKAEEIRQSRLLNNIDVILFNHELSPGQERNLEREFDCRVVDRNRLILDIFAQRARSFEGKLQVELAQLQHLSTRLIRGWTHLERQKGGIGLRGPGETQLETDRRLIGARIRQINERLERVKRQRRQGTRSRRRAMLETVSLVGYTNAGKSTLFNRLSHGRVYTADQLFATLDTTLRRVEVPGENPVVLSDTVGFIRRLPLELIAAFEATLEETRQAGLLLHIVDATADDRTERSDEVKEVLRRIGAGGIPVIEVLNKIDEIDGMHPRVERNADGHIARVWLSARDGDGCHLLLDAIGEYLDQAKSRRWLRVSPAAAKFRAKLYDVGAVIDEVVLSGGEWLIEASVSDDKLRVIAGASGAGADVSEIQVAGSLREFEAAQSPVVALPT